MLTVASTAQRLVRLGSPHARRPRRLGGLNEPRGARRWHARLRVAPLYSVGPVLGPDHEAIIRFGGKAPRRRAHSNERFDDRVLARVTTSDRDRLTRAEEVSAWRAETLCAGLAIVKRSGGWPQHNAIRDFTGGDHAPEGDEQLAGECDDHRVPRTHQQRWRCGAVWEMRVGPSGSAIRSGSQTTASRCRKERWW
jgi:hypothetical protein